MSIRMRVRTRACVGLPQEEILSCERRDPRDPVNNADWNLGTVERGGFQLYSSMQSEASPSRRRCSVGRSPSVDVVRGGLSLQRRTKPLRTD